MDLVAFSPACLPYNTEGLNAQEGHVYGEQCFIVFALD